MCFYNYFENKSDNWIMIEQMCSMVKIKQALIEVPDKDHRRLDVFVF